MWDKIGMGFKSLLRGESPTQKVTVSPIFDRWNSVRQNRSTSTCAAPWEAVPWSSTLNRIPSVPWNLESHSFLEHILLFFNSTSHIHNPELHKSLFCLPLNNEYTLNTNYTFSTLKRLSTETNLMPPLKQLAVHHPYTHHKMIKSWHIKALSE